MKILGDEESACRRDGLWKGWDSRRAHMEKYPVTQWSRAHICMDVSSEILLVVQKDNSDPEAHLYLVAEAIVIFQEKNAKRVNDIFLEPLEMQPIWDNDGRHLSEVLQN